MYKISNVKISFTCKFDYFTYYYLKSFAKKITNTYIILKDKKNRYTYTMYRYNKTGNKHSRTINITGIKSFDLILHAVRTFQSLALDSFSCEQIRIDNSTASGLLSHKLDFVKLAKAINNKYVLKHNLSLFPGAFIRLQNNNKNVILFPSGKFILVGCKSRTELAIHFSEFEQVIQLYNEYECMYTPPEECSGGLA